MTASTAMDPLLAGPCEGSGRPWVRPRRDRPMCPVCDAGPATLRVPDDEPAVPDHPNMVVWSGRVDVVTWRTHRASVRPSEDELIAAIESEGWTVRLVDYCEDSRTPGLLGQILGVTDRERREVKVGLVATGREPGQRALTLAHELRHIREPEWDCGNRDVFGRGGPR